MTMYVDSLKVNLGHRTIEFVWWKTPEIQAIPGSRYKEVRDFVTFEGRFYTGVYGNTKAQTDALDIDDALVEVTSVFIGPKECEMVRKGCYFGFSSYFILNFDLD